MDFWVFLLGMKLGDYIGTKIKIFGIISILIKISVMILSVGAWMTYFEVLKSIVAERNIGWILLAIVLTAAIIFFLFFSIYQIEAKQLRYSKKFELACFAVMAMVFGIEVYIEYDKMNIIYGLYVFIAWCGAWLPKKVLQRVEQLGKKSAFVLEVERQVQRMTNKK